MIPFFFIEISFPLFFVIYLRFDVTEAINWLADTSEERRSSAMTLDELRSIGLCFDELSSIPLESSFLLSQMMIIIQLFFPFCITITSSTFLRSSYFHQFDHMEFGRIFMLLRWKLAVERGVTEGILVDLLKLNHRILLKIDGTHLLRLNVVKVHHLQH